MPGLGNGAHSGYGLDWHLACFPEPSCQWRGCPENASTSRSAAASPLFTVQKRAEERLKDWEGGRELKKGQMCLSVKAVPPPLLSSHPSLLASPLLSPQAESEGMLSSRRLSSHWFCCWSPHRLFCLTALLALSNQCLLVFMFRG